MILQHRPRQQITGKIKQQHRCYPKIAVILSVVKCIVPVYVYPVPGIHIIGVLQLQQFVRHGIIQ